MADNIPSETATIELYYDEKHRQQIIEEEYPDSWMVIGVTVGGTDLWNVEYEVTGVACSIVLQLLESIGVPISGERYIIELEYGPSWIDVGPRDERSVNVAKCVTIAGARNPDERLDIDTRCQSPNADGSKLHTTSDRPCSI